MPVYSFLIKLIVQGFLAVIFWWLENKVKWLVMFLRSLMLVDLKIVNKLRGKWRLRRHYSDINAMKTVRIIFFKVEWCTRSKLHCIPFKGPKLFQFFLKKNWFFLFINWMKIKLKKDSNRKCSKILLKMIFKWVRRSVVD